ncbi:ABC transporter permease [Longispora fulva]|uniref:Osmoprotectant transport system permease protein n=1 Tax=Longispora fulva TaxID=619741 RepID=A0A8J7GZY4_9ACTN|nr:ABC transporter permease [Longispora fulva]MBG6141635.1 osmoprotectant transport system permease protein [Longispora fulva]GIG59210.1 ABC transporter permease [Longispora fulva]
MNWSWIPDHRDLLGRLIADHLQMAVLPILFGLVIALPLGVACARWPRLYGPVLAVTSALYALPSLALFIFLLDFTGLEITTVIIPLTLYTLSVLVRNVVEGLRGVPDSVRQSAVAMGFGAVRRLVQVELPIALPVVIAGLRVATVSNISLVSVGSLIGFGGLGTLFTSGFQIAYSTPIIVGIVLVVGLALIADTLLVLAQRVLTPWSRR